MRVQGLIIKNWKNRLRGKIMEEKVIDLAKLQMEKEREAIWLRAGQLQFAQAIAKAELLQLNQKLLDLNNKISKPESSDEPKVEESNV